MSRDRFDLHTHSTASDGALAPREIVALTAERGLAGVAITDRDTCAGIDEAVSMARVLGIECVPGVEITATCTETNQSVHLLGYFMDSKHQAMQRLLSEIKDKRMQRAIDSIALINTYGVQVSLADVMRIAGEAPIRRKHIAQVLVDRQIVNTLDEALSEQWLEYNGRVYAPIQGIDIRQAVDQIHDAGGVAVYAHPGAYGDIPEQTIRLAAEYGLDGLEVDHPDHDGDALQTSVRLATELDLVQTAGSDDHGVGREGPRLGCRTVPRQVVDRLQDRCRTHT